MWTRLLLGSAAVCLPLACGSSDEPFKIASSAGAGSGGIAAGAGGRGGSSAGESGMPGSGGDAGASAGESATGGTGGSSGTAGESGESGETGTSGETGMGGSGGASGEGGAGPGPEPITIVQASDTVLSLDPVAELSLPDPPHAGNAIIVGITCISDYQGDCVIPAGGVTDTAGNDYTRVMQGEPIPSSSQAARAYLFIAENVIVPSEPLVVTVAPDGASTLQQVAWGAIEVSGLAASPSADATGASLNGSDTATTAITDLGTQQPNELAVAVLSIRSTDTNALIQPETGWTTHHIHQNNSSGPPAHSLVSRVLTSTGIVSHTWTHDAPTRGAAAIIATFRGVSGM